MNNADIIVENVFTPSHFNQAFASKGLEASSAFVQQGSSQAVRSAAIPWSKILMWAVVAAIILYGAYRLHQFIVGEEEEEVVY